MHWFLQSKNKYRTAYWSLVGQKINILPYIIAFYRDNDLKLKFVREKKVDISQWSQCKKMESKPKKISAWIRPIFGGTLLFRQLKPKFLDHSWLHSFTKYFVPEKISHFFPLLAEIIKGSIIAPRPPGPFVWLTGPGTEG